jgi:hypothetical protein
MKLCKECIYYNPVSGRCLLIGEKVPKGAKECAAAKTN